MRSIPIREKSVILLLHLFLLLVLPCLSAAAPAGAPKSGTPPTLYIALWRGCEAACQGFKDGITESGLDVLFIERNAAQDKSKLPGFVQEAKAMQADLVLTWGTTVTLGMVGKLEDMESGRYLENIPVIYMIVADAVGSGIVRSFQETGRPNVTGTHNRVPEEININAIRTYDSGFKKLGMLYTSTENNSAVKVEELRALSKSMGFELIALEFELDPQGQPDVGSIPKKMQELKENGVDFIYVGSSSFIEKNGALFTASAVQHGIPVLSPYERLVTEADALLSVSAKYYAVGRLAARQAIRILRDGTQAGKLPVLEMEKFAFVINMETARKLRRFPPLELLQIAETVH